jgi:hypothetical protein
LGALAVALRPYLTLWQGARKGERGLVHDLAAAPPTAPALFWCFQTGEEFAALTVALGTRIRLFGLRSGHLVFDYDSRTVAALAALYADEIEAVHRHGNLFLGGNCQGGMVMAEVAQELRRRGRHVALTVLMEQGRFHPLSGQVLLLFGARSYLNPYGQIDAPEHLFRQAYGQYRRAGGCPCVTDYGLSLRRCADIASGAIAREGAKCGAASIFLGIQRPRPTWR